MNPAQTLKNTSTDLRQRADVLAGTARDLAYAGLGVVAMLQEEALDAFDTLVREGRRAEDGRATTTTAKAVQAAESDAEQATRKAEAFGKDFEARVVEMVGTVLNKMNVPTRDDIEALKRSVDRLNKKAADLRLS